MHAPGDPRCPHRGESARGPLINRLCPVPLESLDSLLQRLRWANHYQEPTWLQGLLPQPPLRPNQLWRASHYHALSALTGLTIETLVTLTLHRFAPRYDAGLPVAPTRATAPDTLPIPLWPALGRRSWTRDAARAALCPLCWRDQRALLLPWSLRHVTACSRHRVLLIERCTRCRALVTPDVRLSACRQCGQDIGAMPMHSIAEEPDSLAVTALIWSAIGCLPGSFPPATIEVSADHPLRRVGTASMLHGLWACAQRHGGSPPILPACGEDGGGAALLPVAPRRPLQDLPLADVHSQLVAAWRLLRDWNTAWHLPLAPTTNVTAARSGGGVPFPVVLRHRQGHPCWTLADPWWLDFVWERATEGYPWARADLAATPATECATRAPHWKWADLALTLREAAPYCQLNQADLDVLVESGLAPARGGPFSVVFSRWFFSERTLYRGLRAVLAALPVRALTEVTGPSGDLSWALGCAERRGVGIADLLGAVRAGALPAFRTRPTAQLCDLWFAQAAIVAYLEQGHARTRVRHDLTPAEEALWRAY